MGIFGDGPDMLIYSLNKDPQILKLAMIKPLIYLEIKSLIDIMQGL